VILGGLGNVGRILQKELLQTKPATAVHVLDRPHPQAEKALQDPNKCAYSPYNLGRDDPTRLTKLLEGADCVYSVVTPDVQHGTVQDFRFTNKIGMEHLVQACQAAGVPKLVYASSLAVTNHLTPSIQASEKDPLPPMESYQSYYDRTKRQGEEIVLGANNNNNNNASSSPLKTCALRLGAVLASPKDYNFRAHFELGEQSGKIYTFRNAAKIDSIAAADVASAMVKAGDKLSDGGDPNNELQGKALFVTKSRNDETPNIDAIALKVAQLMEWELQYLPPVVMKLLQAKEWMQHSVVSKFKSEDELPGMPPHVFLDIAMNEQTFDNSMAHKVLDWRPRLSWEETVEQIVQDHRSTSLAS